MKRKFRRIFRKKKGRSAFRKRIAKKLRRKAQRIVNGAIAQRIGRRK